MDARKRLTQVAAVAVVAQLIMMVATDNILSVVLPPLLASAPIAILTMYSSETVEVMGPRLSRAYLSVVLFSCAVIASFVLIDKDIRFHVQFTRAVLLDIAIFWFAMIVGVQIVQIHRTTKK